MLVALGYSPILERRRSWRWKNEFMIIFRLGDDRRAARFRLRGSSRMGVVFRSIELGLGLRDPRREILPPHTLICAEDECAGFAGGGAHEREPGVAGVGGGSEVEVYVLGVEGIAEEGHVVFPADGGCKGEFDTGEGGGDGFEGGGRALGPDEAFAAGLEDFD